MNFGWDATKDEATRNDRGFGFADVIEVFDGRETLQFVDNRHDYGEVRVKAIGSISGMVVAVVFTDRGNVRWIISARIASRKERRAWWQRFE